MTFVTSGISTDPKFYVPTPRRLFADDRPGVGDIAAFPFVEAPG